MPTNLHSAELRYFGAGLLPTVSPRPRKIRKSGGGWVGKVQLLILPGLVASECLER